MFESRRTAKAELDNERARETPERIRFPSVKVLLERMEEKIREVFAVLSPRTVKATGAALAFAFSISCGDTNGTTDADADQQDTIEAVQDGAGETSEDAGVEEIEETAPPSLCAMYPDGDAHRVTFMLAATHWPEGSAEALKFMEMDDSHTLFVVLPGADFIGFHTGDQVTRDMYGLGTTTFEQCGRTPNPCSATVSPPTGDVNCTVTLASDRPWHQ